MQTNNWFKNLLPNLIAIVAFVIISALFSAPAVKGDRIAPHDTISWLYMSKEARDYYEKTGQNPGWSNNMFSGMPASMIYQVSPTTWYSHLGSFLVFQSADNMVNPIGYLLLTMIGCFVLLKAMRINTLISSIGAIAYALTAYTSILLVAGHVNKVLNLAYLPGVIGGILYIYRGKYLSGILSFALFFCFYLAAGHIQIIYYSIALILAICTYFLVIAIKEQKVVTFFKSSAIILVIALVGTLTIYPALTGTSDYAKYSIRGGGSELTINKDNHLQETKGGLSKEYAFSWSNGIGETFCAFIPNLYGGASGTDIGEDSHFGEALSQLGVPAQQVAGMTSRAPTYFGDQPFLAGPMYFGAIVCFLAILAMFIIKSPFKWVLLGAAIFFAMLSWGRNFSGLNYWLFDHMPLFNKFRSPNMVLSFSTLITVMLAFWGLYDFITTKHDKAVLFKKFKQAAITTLGIVVALVLYSQFMMSYKSASDDQLAQSFGEHAGTLLKALKEDRAAMALKDGLRSMVFIAIAIAALWALVKERISAQVAVIAIGLASTIDLWSVANRYLNEEAFKDAYTIEQEFFTPRPAEAQIMKDPDPNFKVLDLSINYTNDAKTSYFVKTIGGYHAAKLQSYQDLLETQIGKLNGAVLNMLNTKYIITPGDKGNAAVIPNPAALGNAWFVSKVKYTKTADETVLAMNAPAINDPKQDTAGTAFNPKMEVIVRDQYQKSIGSSDFQADPAARIALTSYAPPHMIYESSNSHDGLAVFSEIYYPEHWTAYVDGKATEIFPVNYVLRAIKVPAGKHKIEFKYVNEKFKKDETMSLLGSVLVTIVLLGTVVFYIIRRKKQQENPEQENGLSL
ncbi:MAG: hypothetical protein EOP54_07170 [Sphingobacteriales bacterium]|nr:MAG: hypothetical protein EOP54_07170 [Sphingobacteriales bacterium]